MLNQPVQLAEVVKHSLEPYSNLTKPQAGQTQKRLNFSPNEPQKMVLAHDFSRAWNPP